MENNPEPLAWAFYEKDGSKIRFIIHDKDRMELWSKGYEGNIVPLYNQQETGSSNSMVEWKISNLYVEGSSPFCCFVAPKVLRLPKLLVVSENMKSYRLDKKIDGEKILQDIQNLVTKFTQTNTNKIPILYIDIRTITSEDTTLIPKIEYKECPT